MILREDHWSLTENAPLDLLQELHMRLQHSIGEAVAGALGKPVLFQKAGNVGAYGFEVALGKGFVSIAQAVRDSLKVDVNGITIFGYRPAVDRASARGREAHGGVIFRRVLQVSPEDRPKVGWGGHGVNDAVEGGIKMLCQMLGLSKATRAERQCHIGPEMLGQATAIVIDTALPREMRRVRAPLV
ncbi:MAG: hypothetical protein JSR91_17450 [Proteobacteria bacterium]|nr:hypothetical protein [Pseudomonadota bacterium]